MELININATAYDSWLSANMSSLRKAIEHLEEPNTNDIIEVTGRMIWQAAQTSVAPEGFEQAYSEIFSPIVKRPYPRLENGDYKYIEIDQGWKLWQAATAQAVPEGFVLVEKELSWVKADHLACAEWEKNKALFCTENRDITALQIEEYRLRWCKNKAHKIMSEYKAMIEAQEQSHECQNP